MPAGARISKRNAGGGGGTQSLTVCTGTVSGMPAKNDAMRHSLALCELAPRTLPMTMSPMS